MHPIDHAPGIPVHQDRLDITLRERLDMLPDHPAQTRRVGSQQRTDRHQINTGTPAPRRDLDIPNRYP
jgi:hypothetical protein